MKRWFIWPALLAIALPSAANAEITNDRLLERCGQRSTTFTEQGNRSGDSIDGYCAAYLVASAEALRYSSVPECTSREERTPEFLLAVYVKYIKQRKISGSAGASKTIFEAYQKAFDCASH